MKLLLRQYGLNDASVGGLSSFVIFHMVFVYSKISRDITFASFFINLMKFYAYEFDHESFTLITDKNQELGTDYKDYKKIKFPNSHLDNLSIQSLLNSSLDVGTAAREYPQVKRLFAACLQQLKTNYLESIDKTMSCNLRFELKMLKKIIKNDENFNNTF